MKPRTKSILIYIGGVVTGIVLIFVLAFFVRACGNTSNDGITMYEKPQAEIPQNEFSVIQVLEDGSAIATTDYGSVAVLFLADDGESYYDGQKIYISQGEVLRQVGTYRYENRDKFIKTIPVVKIFNN